MYTYTIIHLTVTGLAKLHQGGPSLLPRRHQVRIGQYVWRGYGPTGEPDGGGGESTAGAALARGPGGAGGGLQTAGEEGGQQGQAAGGGGGGQTPPSAGPAGQGPGYNTGLGPGQVTRTQLREPDPRSVKVFVSSCPDLTLLGLIILGYNTASTIKTQANFLVGKKIKR